MASGGQPAHGPELRSHQTQKETPKNWLWLRRNFSEHPVWVSLAMVAALAGLPILVKDWRESHAMPTVWEDVKTHREVKIHQEGDSWFEEGKLPYLNQGTPYTTEFLCQTSKAFRDGKSFWEGNCKYEFAVLASGLHCTVLTRERLMVVDKEARKIIGCSQPLDAPKKAGECPQPKGGPAGKLTERFELRPKDGGGETTPSSEVCDQ